MNGHWEDSRRIPDDRPGVVSRTWLVTWGVLGLFWILGTVCFINVTPMVEGWRAIWPPLQLAADILIILMGLLTLRNRFDIINVCVFVSVCIASMLVNGQSPVNMLNGMRIYTGAVFSLPIFRHIFSRPENAAYFINKFDRTLYWFLWLQWPCMLYEFLNYGACDYGGGSLGNLMSGIISTLIFVISFYLMQRRWRTSKSYLANIRDNWTLILLLGPTMLNETKISLIYLLLYFLLLIPINRRFILSLSYLLPIIVAIGIGGGYLYANFTTKGDTVLTADYLEYYVFGDDDLLNMVEYIYDRGYAEEDHDMQRGVKMMMFPAIIDDKPHGPVIGYGVSQFKGGKTLEQSDFYKTYEWLLEGTQLQFMDIVIDMGFVGFGWFIYYTLILFGFTGRGPGDKKKTVNRNLRWMLFIVWVMNLFYQAVTSQQLFIVVYTFLCVASWNWDRIRAYDALIRKCEEETADAKALKTIENESSARQ